MNLEQARFNMVEQQVRTWEVLDQRVLDVLHAVAREDFVPTRYRQMAYADLQIPLEHGEKMLPPVVEGRLLQAAQLKPTDSVVEVGLGSGYLTACLACLSANVQAIDINPEFVDAAHKRISGLTVAGHSISTVNLQQADGCDGWQPDQTADVVLVGGSLPYVPENFLHWLKPNGRLLMVVGQSPLMEARLITRTGDQSWQTESLFETDISPLQHVELKQPFEF